MKWTIVVIIIILLLAGGIATAIILVKKSSSHIHPHNGGGKSVMCKANLDPSLMISCDPTDPKACSKCEGGPRSCYVVDDQHPFHFKYANKPPIQVPNSEEGKGWCLPTRTTTYPCNQFSGKPILVQISPTEDAWACHCRYPHLFQTSGEFGDCLDEIACGIQHNDGELVCPDGHDFCKGETPWIQKEMENDKVKTCSINKDCGKGFECVGDVCMKGSNYDPKVSVCKCKAGLKYVDQSYGGAYIKTCQNDSCAPNGVIKDGKCDCTISYDEGKPYKKISETEYRSFLECPDQFQTGACTQNDPQCIPDPCNPSGYWDTSTNSCKCLVSGSSNYPTEASITGYICKDVCRPNPNKPDETPCGDRGICYTQVSANDPNTMVGKCRNCNYPYEQNPPVYPPLNKDDCADTDKFDSGKCGIWTTDRRCLEGVQVGQHCVDNSNTCAKALGDVGASCKNGGDCLSGCCLKDWIFGGKKHCEYGPC